MTGLLEVQLDVDWLAPVDISAFICGAMDSVLLHLVYDAVLVPVAEDEVPVPVEADSVDVQ